MFITKHKTSLLATFLIAVMSAAILLSSATALAVEPATVSDLAAVATVKVTNPYGLEALWKTGDFVSKGTLMILVIMSMGSWYIIVLKFFEQRKLSAQARAISESFWKAESIQSGVSTLEKGNAFGFIAENALQANEHHAGKLAENIDHNTWLAMQIQRSIQNVQSRMQEGLAFLATVGSTAPFVGLFGTVWGIYHALTSIAMAGQASLDVVAGPVGEALIMTAFGLAVALPALFGYNWLVRKNKLAMEKVRDFGADIHAILMGASASTRGGVIMGMNISMADAGDEDEVVSTINTTPLVDVMLVLLIIFLITIPVAVHSVPVELPKESNVVTLTKPENILLSVNRDGEVFWNTLKVEGNEALVARLKQVSVQKPQPEVHIRGDMNARYEAVGRLVFACQRAGIVKVGFIIEPPPKN